MLKTNKILQRLLYLEDHYGEIGPLILQEGLASYTCIELTNLTRNLKRREKNEPEVHEWTQLIDLIKPITN